MATPTTDWSPERATKIAAAKHYAARKIAPYMSDMVFEGVIWNHAAVPTACISERGNIRTSDAFVDRCSVPALATVIMHEHLHIFLRHFRGKDLIERGVCSAGTWNEAADYSVNGWLDAHAATEWPAGLTPLLPSAHGWDNGLTAEDYLTQILDEREAEQPEQGDEQGEQGDDSGEAGEQAGEGAGESSEQAEGTGAASGSGDEQGDDSGEAGEVGAGDCGSGVTGQPTEADRFVDEETGKTAAAMENQRRKVAEHVAEAARSTDTAKTAGTVPGFLKRAAEATLAPPAVSWKTVLRRAVRKSLQSSKGSPKRTTTRVNRRQGGIGFGASKPLLKGVKRNQSRVIVGVDTSGSMAAAELEQAVREVAGIVKQAGRAVRFVACDTKVQAVAEVRRPEQVIENLKGGGGTDFVDLFDGWLAGEAGDLFVFITDGWGEVPAAAPEIPTLFVSVGPGSIKPYVGSTSNPAPWGEHVTVTPEGRVK